MNFLLEILTDGPMAQIDISNLAEAEGHSHSTLQKAKKKLGVESKQIHKDGKISAWEWSLPAKPGSLSSDMEGQESD